MFKIRASACGKIMTNARKKGELSKTCTSYLEQWVKEQIYGRQKEISSKYMEKGLIMEDESIDFVNRYLGFDGLMLKNEKHFKDDFMTGTPDVITKKFIVDVKNSWDFSTFPLFGGKPNTDYYWQGQVYMHLTGVNHFKLIYTLMDTPEHLIEREAFSYAKRWGYEKLTDEIYNKFLHKMTYKDIEEKHKIKVFDIPKDDEAIEQIKQRVKECQDYINQLNY